MLNAMSKEEQYEAMLHDAYYQRAGNNSLLIKDDWMKFDTKEKPLNGYIDSIQRLGNLRGKRGLDLGCGVGWMSVILAKRGAFMEGIEISSVAVEKARAMAKVNGVQDRVNFHVASAYNLPFKEESFDFVIGQAILHHLGDKDRASREVKRILRKSGKAVFFECFGESLILERMLNIVHFILGDEIGEDWKNQIGYKDIKVMQRYFDIKFREFHFFSRLDSVLTSKMAIKSLNIIDNYLLSSFPIVRRYARAIVIEANPSI